MRIRFLKDQVYETDGPGRGPRFRAGHVLDAADVGDALGCVVAPEWAAGFLRRWLQRGVAEEVDRRTPATEIAEAGVSPEQAPQPEPIHPPASEPPAEQPSPEPRPVPASDVSQPLGTAKRGRPTKGNG